MEQQTPRPCGRDFLFTVPEAAVKAESARVMNFIAGSVQLPGFRQGKAPLNLVKSKYADAIRDELRNRCVSAAAEKIEKLEDIDVLTLSFKEQPDIRDGEEIKFSFTADVAPEFDLGDYKSIKVDIPLDQVTDEDIDKKIELYRGMYGTYAEIDDKAAAEDMLKVNYKSDYTLPEDATATLKRQISAENTFLWLSEPELIPGCIAALTGKGKGETVVFTAEYPADFREKELAGKKLEYSVEILDVQRRTKLSDAELIEKLGVDSIEKFREILRSQSESEQRNKQLNAAADAVYRRLEESAGEFDLPQSLLENEIQKEIQRIARETVKSEEEAEKFKADIEAHRSEAEKSARANLRRMLILRKLAKLEKTALEPGELEYRMRAMSGYYGYKPNKFRDMMEKSGAIDELRMDIITSKALETLAREAVVK